ncbi:hypothetical protein ACTFIT_012388 [Dictyostelium discoideum]
MDKILERHHDVWCVIGYLVNKYQTIRSDLSNETKLVDFVTNQYQQLNTYPLDQCLKDNENIIVIIPLETFVINQVISIHHDSALAGVIADIKDYCSNYKICICASDSRKHQIGLLSPLSPSRCFSEISMDFLSIDRLSKYVVLIPIPSSTNSKDIFPLSQDQVMFTFRFPSVIISDNDPLFSSNSWSKFLINNNVKHHTCLPYHHQATVKQRYKLES